MNASQNLEQMPRHLEHLPRVCRNLGQMPCGLEQLPRDLEQMPRPSGLSGNLKTNQVFIDSLRCTCRCASARLLRVCIGVHTRAARTTTAKAGTHAALLPAWASLAHPKPLPRAALRADSHPGRAMHKLADQPRPSVEGEDAWEFGGATVRDIGSHRDAARMMVVATHEILEAVRLPHAAGLIPFPVNGVLADAAWVEEHLLYL